MTLPTELIWSGSPPSLGRRLSVIILTVLALASATVQTVLACSCLPPGTPQEELSKSQAVFSGRVASMRTAPNRPDSLPSVAATIEVDRVWKGAVTAQTIVLTADNSAACGVPFAVGDRYLIYATSDGGSLTASLCSRTRTLAEAGEDITALGPGSAPRPGGPLPRLPATGSGDEPAGGPTVWPWLLLGLATGGGTLWLVRRRLQRG